MSKPGAILFLDQSLSSTGFALMDDGELIETGAWPLCDGTDNRREGYRQLWGKMQAIHEAKGIGLIVHEAVAFGAVSKGEAQLLATAGLVGIIDLFSVSRGMPRPIAYAPRSWRSTFFTKLERQIIAAKPTKIRDWKHPAILRCRQLGFDPASSDEAEAIGIADHHLIKNKIMPAWRKNLPVLDSVV